MSDDFTRAAIAARLETIRTYAADIPAVTMALHHIDYQEAEIARLRGLIDRLECGKPVKQDVFFERDGKRYFRVENVPCGKCPVCRAKLAAQSLDKADE